MTTVIASEFIWQSSDIAKDSYLCPIFNTEDKSDTLIAYKNTDVSNHHLSSIINNNK